MTLSYTDAAAEVMEHLCTHSAHGYSQPNRQGIGTGGTVGETITLSDGSTVGISYGDRDCSSAVIECFKALGVAVGGATYTGNMKTCMVGSGNFRALPASTWKNPQRGDILLNQGKHTAMALGNGKLGEFLRSENHTTSGTVGDQDGGESVVRALYDDEWDCVLRYCGAARPGSQTSDGGTSTSSDYLVKTSGTTYRVNIDELNVRAAPSTGAAIVATYKQGETVALQNAAYTTADGYVWGSYVACSGATRYVAVKRADKKTGTTGVVAGRYKVVDKSGLNVRANPSTSAAIVATYKYGQTVYLDGTSKTADGFIWGRYRGGSGKLRWVAVTSTGGTQVLAQRVG